MRAKTKFLRSLHLVVSGFVLTSGLAACGGSSSVEGDAGPPPDGSPGDGSLADASMADSGGDSGDAPSPNGDSGLDAMESGSDAMEAGSGPLESGADATDGMSSATDASPDASAKSWTPASLGTRLAFWFDPTSLVAVSGSVIQWADLSGKGNNANQAVGSYQPTYTANGIGGLPSATFTGPVSFLTIADSASMQFGTSDCAVFAVVLAEPTSNSDAMLYQKTGLSPYNGLALYINSSKPVQSGAAGAQVSGALYVLSSPPPATFASSVHLLGARRQGATLEMRVDGAVSGSLAGASVATVDVSSAGYPAQIGQNGYSHSADFEQFVGKIAEMVGVGGVMSSAEVSDLETYLKARYAIP